MDRATDAVSDPQRRARESRGAGGGARRAAGAWTQVLVLGDLVGYGADPNAVVERVRALPIAAIVRGNHDKVATGLAPVDSFNHVARQAIEWTARVLTPDNLPGWPRCPQGPTPIDDAGGDLPRRAVRRGLLSVRRAGRAARAAGADAAAVPVRAHARAEHLPDRDRRGAERPVPRRAMPRPRLRRSAARRSSTAAPSASRATAIRAPPSACSDTATRTVTARRASPTTSQAAQAKILAAGLPPSLAPAAGARALELVGRLGSGLSRARAAPLSLRGGLASSATRRRRPPRATRGSSRSRSPRSSTPGM